VRGSTKSHVDVSHLSRVRKSKNVNFDEPTIEKVKPVRLNRFSNALLCVYSGSCSVVNAVKFFCGNTLHFRHGGKRGEGGAKLIPFS